MVSSDNFFSKRNQKVARGKGVVCNKFLFKVHKDQQKIICTVSTIMKVFLGCPIDSWLGDRTPTVVF